LTDRITGIGIKLKQIEMLVDFEVLGYKLAGMAEASGYTIDLEKETVLVCEYALMSSFALRFSIFIVTSGGDRHFIMERLTQALHTTLSIQ